MGRRQEHIPTAELHSTCALDCSLALSIKSVAESIVNYTQEGFQNLRSGINQLGQNIAGLGERVPSVSELLDRQGVSSNNQGMMSSNQMGGYSSNHYNNQGQGGQQNFQGPFPYNPQGGNYPNDQQRYDDGMNGLSVLHQQTSVGSSWQPQPHGASSANWERQGSFSTQQQLNRPQVGP